jgi:16S rRNA (guanine527-N7)-methyltransferase
MSEPEKKFRLLIEPVLRRVKLSITNQQVKQLYHHYFLLTQWNQKVSLTSIREPIEILERHFGESLFLAAKLPAAKTLVDIGSGAGFPGLPLAVARPTVKVTLVESTAKKAAFLREAARGIGNVRVLHTRAENIQEGFEWAVCRAIPVKKMLPVMKSLAVNIALMTSETVASDLKDELGSRIPIPWGNQRILLLGHFGKRRST